MNLRKQKQLAARALNVSPKRVKLNDAHKKEISELISRESVNDLVSEGAIKKLPKKGNSRTRANHIAEQKKKGRQKGHGSRKGTQNARFNEKNKWMIKIRSLRSLLKTLKENETIDTKTYRDLYRKAKGNFFRNKRHVMLYIDQHHILEKGESAKRKGTGKSTSGSKSQSQAGGDEK